MKRILVLLLVFLSSFQSAFAKTQTRPLPSESVQSWAQYDEFMKNVELDNRRMAWSYILSGSLVTLGGLIGGNSSSDSAMQLVLGLSTTSGLAGISYGLIRLNSGSEYSTLYETLKRSSLSETERWSLLQDYIRMEREKEDDRKRIKLISHLVAAGLNMYSAAAVSDPNSKTVLHVFAALNVAFAFSYSF